MVAERWQHMSRRRMLRSLVACASALGVAPLLGACGQGPPTTAEADPTIPPQVQAPVGTPTPETAIEVWYYDNSIDKMIEGFKRAHPTIDVRLRSAGDVETALLRVLKSGKGLPDVGVYWSISAGALAQSGGLADLSAAPFDAATRKGDFVQAAWDGGISAEGKLVGMPLSVYVGTYWYRADVLAEAGFESDPERLAERLPDWPSLFQFAKEFTAKRPGASLLPRAFFDVFATQLAQQGASLVENSKLLIEENCTQPAQQALLARTLKLDLPDVDIQSAWDEAVRNDNIAGLFAPTWFQGYISNIYSNQVGKWRSIAPPGGAFLQGAQYLCIPAASSKQEAAWKFVSYCTSVEGQNTFLTTSGDFPAFKQAWADTLYDAPVGFFGGQRVYRTWATLAESGKMTPASPYDAAIFDALGIALRKVADGELDVASGLQGVEQQIATANPGLTL